MKNRSIGEKLKRVKTYEAQQKVLSDWVENWKEDQLNVVKKLRYAATHDDHSEIMHMIQQLEGMTEKRFGALNNVMRTISDSERKLNHYEMEIKEEPLENDSEGESIVGNDDVTKIAEVKDESEELVLEMVKGYNAGLSIKEMAKLSEISEGKVKKILVTAGVYTSEVYDRVKDMRLDGISDEEIAYRLDLGKSAMAMYTPYQKGIYGLKNPSKNAMKIREYRKCKE